MKAVSDGQESSILLSAIFVREHVSYMLHNFQSWHMVDALAHGRVGTADGACVHIGDAAAGAQLEGLKVERVHTEEMQQLVHSLKGNTCTNVGACSHRGDATAGAQLEGQHTYECGRAQGVGAA
eukprot:scaffold26698_cov17-Tisochrysis_lutea.AAC.1